MVKITICFFFNDTATTEIYTLSLHDALPISAAQPCAAGHVQLTFDDGPHPTATPNILDTLADRGVEATFFRSEEHTSELQSRQYLVCRLLLEKKKTTITIAILFCSHSKYSQQ